MCGIAGWLSSDGDLTTKLSTLYQMNQSQKHRGPDAEGALILPNAALLHRRLSVVDLEKGAQPMTRSYHGETFTLVYNGELYNTEDLRQELVKHGFTFNGHSDTEVLLCCYLHWGQDCVLQLNGIFAFAIYEHQARRLFLARDRMGVKPLYYHTYPTGLLFASELKALFQSGMVAPEVDQEGLWQLFLLGPSQPPDATPYVHIRQLPPAHCATWEKDRGLTVRRYWHLIPRPHTDSTEQTLATTRQLVCDAIQRQLVSDVPLCCFLSGGLDSSIISAVAANYHALHHKGPLGTVSVEYKDNAKYFTTSLFQPNSDEAYIDVMSQYIGSAHTKTILDNVDLAKALWPSTRARDLPGMADVDSSLYLFCQDVRRQYTVGLSGECADEIFGGYPWYHRPELLNANDFPWSGNAQHKTALMHRDFRPQDPDAYVRSFYDHTIGQVPVLSTDTEAAKRHRQMFVLNLDWFMQTLLTRKDRMSMAHSLEVRVPFCDHRIVEYIYNVPFSLLSLHGREKGLLRSAFFDLLPEEIAERKKSPYPKTHHPQYVAYVKKMLQQVLQDRTMPLHQVVDTAALQQLIDTEGASFTRPWYGQLMTTPQIYAYFLQINQWMIQTKVRLV